MTHPFPALCFLPLTRKIRKLWCLKSGDFLGIILNVLVLCHCNRISKMVNSNIKDLFYVRVLELFIISGSSLLWI